MTNILLKIAATALLACATLAHAGPTYDLSPEQAGRARIPKNEKRIAEIPKTFKFVKAGVLTVAISEAAFFPLHDFASDNKTPIGYHPDLAQLVADSLGRRLEIVSVAWADWPLGLASGKYDVVISNVTVTEERKEKFDFSTYRKDLAAFFVRRESPITAIKEPKDIAGLKIITSSGTNFEKIMLEWNRRNIAAGLKPIELQFYEDEAVERLALLSGRAHAKFHANPTQVYSASRDGGKTRPVGYVNGGWPITADNGIVSRKGSGLAIPLSNLINDLIANGDYRKLNDRWHLQEEAVETSYANPPGLPKPVR